MTSSDDSHSNKTKPSTVPASFPSENHQQVAEQAQALNADSLKEPTRYPSKQVTDQCSEGALSPGNYRSPIPTRVSRRSSVASSIQSHLSVKLPNEIANDIVELSAEYDDLLTDIEECLDKKMKCDGTTLRSLARLISRHQGKKYVPSDQGLDDLLYPITQELSCIDPDLELLYKLDLKFCDKIFKPKLKAYSDQLENFLTSTTIEHFISVLKDTRLSIRNKNRSSCGSETEIIIRVSSIYKDQTVQLISQLKKKIFGKLSFSFGLVSVHHSVLTMVYTVPMDLASSVLTVALARAELLKQVQVLSVQVGNIKFKIFEEEEGFYNASNYQSTGIIGE